MEMALGEEGRVIDKLPFKLAISDRDFALLPLRERTPAGEQAALLIKASVLVESLSALFDAMWLRAMPLHPSGDDLVPDYDEQLLELTRLLAAGMQDARIARYLGISERTVRRRVAEKLAALGVETKFHAALRARELGWI
jgi:DNA-binding NarL/FixJ family response regulator